MAENEKQENLNLRQNNITNRQRREEEEKQMKMLKIFGLSVCGIVAVCLFIALILGIVNKPSRKVVAKIGDETIKLDEYQAAVSLQRSNMNNNYSYMQQLYSMFGMEMDESTRESYASQMSDAYKGILGQQVLSNMIDQRIMAYGADKEGITVSDEEIEASYRGMFGYYPDGTPTPAPTSEPFEATPTVTDEQLAVLRYTETPIPVDEVEEETVTDEVTEETAEEAAAETAEEIVEEAVEETAAETVDEVVEEVAEETPVETVEETVKEAVEEAVEEAAADKVEEAAEAVEEAVEETAEDVTADVDKAVSETAELIEDIVAEPTEAVEPTLAPTPTVYTEDMFKQYESYYFANNFYFTKDYLKKEIRYELLEEKVKDKIEESVPRTVDMVWARHILVETEEEALAALERINSGEEWGDVAAEVSTDSTASAGGDLGWFTEGTMVQAFNDAAFSQEVGTISDPVQTEFGYHLIQVIAHEEHPYTSSQYQTAVDNAYQKWLDSYAEQLDVSFETDLTSLTPVEPAFVG